VTAVNRYGTLMKTWGMNNRVSSQEVLAISFEIQKHSHAAVGSAKDRGRVIYEVVKQP
jgi:hypothetical protein